MCADEASETIHEARPIYSGVETRWLDEPLIVERAGHPTAVIISLEEYRRFAAWREERAARRAWVLECQPRNHMTDQEWDAQFVTMDRFATHFADITDDELADELTQAVSAVRAERARR
ncbi:MAG: hypothetical protein AUK03_03730 [Anaerolineae bacterium CG2_30_64_16]|nr:MAG: hypothetical protein AUK03_03730 [Anaerolineae bacterium CG2_30_64_16]